MTGLEMRRRWKNIFVLCAMISQKTKADCFFNYYPHINGVCVDVYEFGWTPWSKGERLLETYDGSCRDEEALEKAEEFLVELAIRLGI